MANKAWRREATNPEDGLTIIFAASPESLLHGEEPPKSAEESKTYILNAHSGLVVVRDILFDIINDFFTA